MVRQINFKVKLISILLNRRLSTLSSYFHSNDLNFYFDFNLFVHIRVDWEAEVAKNGPIAIKSNNQLQNVSAYYYNSMSNSDSVSHQRENLLIIYTILMIFTSLCYIGRAFLFYRMGIRISINLHDMIFRGITRAKMIFFNINPSGRILNRFARDINIVDSMLPSSMLYVMDVS